MDQNNMLNVIAKMKRIKWRERKRGAVEREGVRDRGLEAGERIWVCEILSRFAAKSLES